MSTAPQFLGLGPPTEAPPTMPPSRPGEREVDAALRLAAGGRHDEIEPKLRRALGLAEA